MNRRNIIFAALTFVGLYPGHAQDVPLPISPVVPAVATSASPTYPQVSCTSTDPIVCVDALQLASDTRDQLAGLLKLGPTWRFPVHLHILTPDDPLTAKLNREAAATFSLGSTMKIEAIVPVGDLNAREFIQRQFVTALLYEKFFANVKAFDKNTHLDVVPLWLIEGLRETLDQDPDHNRERIVKRAVQNQSTPTLDDVTGWHELSDDRLLGIWQRSFCYYLVQSLTRDDSHREDFQLWLDGFAWNSANSQLHFPMETDWQRELVDAAKRTRVGFYTWAETLNEIKAAQIFTYAASKDSPVQTVTVDNAAKLPRSQPLIEAVKERITILTELERLANPSWHDSLELYRLALTTLIGDKNFDAAGGLLEDAHRHMDEEIDLHQKMLDYVNWFEVTKEPDEPTRFGSYYDTAAKMEKVEADPAHPNPIRASVLQIESHLQ